MSFDITLRNPGGGFNIVFGAVAPPLANKIFIGSAAVTLPGFARAYVGAVQIYPPPA